MKKNCDFCGNKREVFTTHFGSGFGYTRFMCNECKDHIEKQYPGTKVLSIKEEKELQNNK